MKIKKTINENIKSEMVFVVSDTGEKLGIMPLEEGLKIAKSKHRDLVEVSKSKMEVGEGAQKREVECSVCRIMDYSKYKFEKQKSKKKQKQKSKSVVQKTIRLRPCIAQGDLERKMKQVVGFLEDGNKVTINIFLKGRDISNRTAGDELIEKIENALEGQCNIEKQSCEEGSRCWTLNINPLDG